MKQVSMLRGGRPKPDDGFKPEREGEIRLVFEAGEPFLRGFECSPLLVARTRCPRRPVISSAVVQALLR